MEQSEVFAFVLGKVESLGLPYMVVGSVASISYGEPRMTLDMDVVIDIRPEDVSRFCAEFPQDEFYVSPHAILDAIVHRSQFNKGIRALRIIHRRSESSFATWHATPVA